MYEELGQILRAEDPKAAVDLYCSFPFSAEGDFAQNALRVAAIKTSACAQGLRSGGRQRRRLAGMGDHKRTHKRIHQMIHKIKETLYFCSSMEKQEAVPSTQCWGFPTRLADRLAWLAQLTPGWTRVE